ncbi:MAG: recombinase zinc beta ribbon domain-containing protein, partial [Oscillospiraceae bacterium]|nr:recombinase zinc beta ribbon domain-containing protein [Oscillospiraceae bacterium]
HKKLGYKSKKTVWLPRENWICVPGTHPGLISREDFDRVQALLAQKARGGGGGRVHPLAGKVKCGLCGGGMEQTGNSRGRRYFRCRLAGRSGLCPGQGYAPAAELEALAAARLKEHAAGWLAGRPWEKFSSSAPAGGQKRGQAAKARQELARLQQGREQLYLDKCTGLLSSEEFARMNGSFRQKEEALKETLAAAQEKPVAPQQSPARRARQLLEWQTLPRELVALVLEEIRIYPKEEDGSRRAEFRWLF